jgi:phosphoribosyl 1,2-cyclic phosphodiesterase
MRVRFRGVRGSVPWATPDSIVHGCNTPCLELQDEKTGGTLILDAGSGIVGVGEHLTAGDPRPTPILLTHYHWDHTQGLPFFSPFYRPGWRPAVWAPVLQGVSLEWVEAIFKSPYFPVPFEQLPNRPAVTLVRPGRVEIDGFDVRVQALNHPGGAFAYRIRGTHGDLVYATDHEFGVASVDSALAEFCRGAAALISDAHFTPDELPQHRGWGHASWRQVTECAAAADVAQLFLFHHKPGRSDAAMTAIEGDARQAFPETIAAREGMTFEV